MPYVETLQLRPAISQPGFCLSTSEHKAGTSAPGLGRQPGGDGNLPSDSRKTPGDDLRRTAGAARQALRFRPGDKDELGDEEGEGEGNV